MPYQTAEASAAIVVWADALRRAQSFDTEKLRDALAATDLQTFYGPVKFNSAGRNIGKPMVLRQVQHDKYVVVAPSQFAADPVEYPRTVAQQ